MNLLFLVRARYFWFLEFRYNYKLIITNLQYKSNLDTILLGPSDHDSSTLSLDYIDVLRVAQRSGPISMKFLMRTCDASLKAPGARRRERPPIGPTESPNIRDKLRVKWS